MPDFTMPDFGTNNDLLSFFIGINTQLLFLQRHQASLNADITTQFGNLNVNLNARFDNLNARFDNLETNVRQEFGNQRDALTRLGRYQTNNDVAVANSCLLSGNQQAELHAPVDIRTRGPIPGFPKTLDQLEQLDEDDLDIILTGLVEEANIMVNCPLSVKRDFVKRKWVLEA